MNSVFLKTAAAVTVVACVGAGVAWKAGVFNGGFQDGGIDVSNTACEDIAAARQAVTVEYEQRIDDIAETLAADKDKASDEYWAENQRLEAEYHQCISDALTADPCKEPFDRGSRLYEEIMADFEAGKGFNEAKFNEREQAKKEYNECLEKTQKPDFYEEKKAACDTALQNGKDSNQQTRVAAEAAAQQSHDQSVATATSARDQKMAILDRIEEKCKEPAATKNVGVGALTTAGSGASIQSSSPACTGIFEGNDPDVRRRIAELESQLQKARAAGMSDGLFGTSHLQSALDELKQELKDSERTCQTDADCGNTEPVCCSTSQVGRVFCSNGVCANETVDCTTPEICAGKPAQCVAPDTGARQQDGIYISRTIPEEGTCSQNLQTLDLQQTSEEARRYAIVGNIPNWVQIDKPSGTLPSSVAVSYSCNTVQGFGPGTYTVNGSVTVYNAANELINTIPLTIIITVTPVEKNVEVIEYNGKQIPLSEVRRVTGPECDQEEHWHANSGAARALDGTVIPDASDCGYGKTKNVPVKTVPDPR